MAEKLIMGYWDCAFCGEKKIPGTQRACPACGKVRGADAVFYMDDAKQELTEEQAKTKGKGADWYCSYCDSLNSVLDENCKSCGASRAESERNYHELQEKKRQDAEKKAAQKREVEVKRENPQVTKKRSPLIFLIPLLIIGALIFAMLPKKADMKITDVYWHNVIGIDKNQQVEENDWYLPEGGELQKTQKEIYGYEKVFDHYETVHYQERVKVGSHTEYTYKDNGDGSFTEIPHEIADYGYEDRTKEEAVYRDEPVYKTKYYYLIWRWLPERTVETDGHDKDPKWGDTNLGDDEKESYRTSDYSVTAVDKKSKEKEYRVSEAIWNQLNVGDQIECKVRGSEIIELK